MFFIHMQALQALAFLFRGPASLFLQQTPATGEEGHHEKREEARDQQDGQQGVEIHPECSDLRLFEAGFPTFFVIRHLLFSIFFTHFQFIFTIPRSFRASARLRSEVPGLHMLWPLGR